jgi:acetyl esterase/lipase
MRIAAVLLAIAFSWPLRADEPRVHRGLPYASTKNERQTLDVHAPSKGDHRPVVVWIHGGGWRAGDKASVQKKPRAFVDRGYVFVSTNYRFVPQVTVKEMAGDIARAIRWVHDHARKYGGDPGSIFVMGHSAGAHLAALVCTDARYLKAEGLPLSIIKGCVPVDTAVYDVPRQTSSVGPARAAMYRSVFGKDEASQKAFSPISHVARGKSIPPFLILHVADRADSRSQSRMLAEKLKGEGVSAQVVAAAGTNHGTINANLGLPTDKPTLKIWEFMKASLSRIDPALSRQVEKLKTLGARITLDDQGRVVGINLGERRITDADLVHLGGFQHLQELDLTRTRITKAGLVHLKDLTTLRRLFLTDTKVDDSGIMHLKGLKALGLIGLSGTRIGDAGLDHLRECTGLKQVFCLGTSVTAAGVKKLQRALPSCQITH